MKITRNDTPITISEPLLYQLSVIILTGVPLILLWIRPSGIPVSGDTHDALSLWMFAYAYEDALVHFGEWPLWNPFIGGGVYFSGHNLASGFQLSTLLSIIFGHVIAIKLNASLHLIGGVLGTWLFSTRVLRNSLTETFFATACVAGSSWFCTRIFEGNYSETSYMLIPLCAWLFYRTLEKSKLALILLLFCTQMLISDARPGFIFALLLSLMALLSYIRLEKKPLLPTLKNAMIVVALTFLFSAPRIIPFLHGSLTNTPQGTTRYQWIPPARFLSDFFLSTGFPSAYMIGVSNIILYFAVFGILLHPRRSLWILLLLLPSVWILFGRDAPIINLYDSMLTLPVLHSLGSVASHFTFWLLLLFSLLAAQSMRLFEMRQLQALSVIPSFLLVLSLISPSLQSSMTVMQSIFSEERPLPQASNHFFQVKALDPYSDGSPSLIDKGTRWRRMDFVYPYTDEYQNYIRGIGTIDYYCSDLSPEKAIPKYYVDKELLVPNENYQGEAYLIGKESVVKNIPFKTTYNSISVVLPPRSYESRLVINQNYHTLWQYTPSKPEAYNGLLSIVVPPGMRQTVQLHFIDPYFTRGLILFGIGIFFTTLVLVREYLPLLPRRTKK